MRKKYRILLIYWTAAIILLPNAAYAYIDPATTTYLIQIATALVVMVGVSLTVFLYQLKKITSKIIYSVYALFHRIMNRRDGSSNRGDANRGDGSSIAFKGDGSSIEEPSPLSFVKPGSDSPPELSSFSEKYREALAAVKEKSKTGNKYLSRLRMTIPLAIALSFTFIVIGCMELAVIHAPEIPFRLTIIVPYVVLMSAIAAIALIIIIPIFKGKILEILFVLGMAVLLGGYIQGNFLNWGIGALTGDAVIWSALIPQMIASLICWAGSFILCAFLAIKAKNIWRNLIIFIPILLILLQSVSIASAVNDNSNQNVWGEGVYWWTADESLTLSGINKVGSDKNAIIIVLDRFDQEFVEEIEPEFFDPLDGFTQFDDFITHYGSTFPAVTGFLTGHNFMYDMPRQAYFDYAWANAVFLQTLKENGVDIRLYMDKGFSFNNTRQLGGLASNTFSGDIAVKKQVALVKLLKLSGYRYAPLPLKKVFWFSPSEFVDALVLSDENAPYMVNDFAFYEKLMTDGLDFSGCEDTFKYIHMKGPHPPFIMDENIQYVGESDFLRQGKGSLKIVYEYLRQLKELGLYEDSVIVIMGDHGNYLGDELTGPARTMLFVKPAGSYGTRPTLSHAPVSLDQLHATIMESLYGDTKGFGDTFFDVKEGDDVVRHYAINLWRYEIRGDGRDFANWRFIGLFPDTYT